MDQYSYFKIFIALATLSFAGQTHLIAQGNTAFKELDINNVRTRFYSGGSMMQGVGGAKYEIPKGSGKHTIYGSGLWIGGLSQGNLHLAAETYRQGGADYWPGPLDTASAVAADPLIWDKVWKANKTEIDNHVLNWNQTGYITPQSIIEWPGNPPLGSGFASILAPFTDLNSNQLYEPSLGEVPFIQGDQAVYFIYNDNYGPHTETGCASMGVEIHGMAYAFDRPNDSALNNTVFVRFEIANRSTNNYDSVFIGLWTDFEIGNGSDDYAGTDVGRNMCYGYNGDADDEGAAGYGLNPPVQGMLFLNQNLAKSVYYNNVMSMPAGNPQFCDDFYQYLSGQWLDGLPMTYGGNGYDPASTDYCDFMFPGTTDSSHNNILWNMIVAGSSPIDVRMLGSAKFPLLPAGGSIVLDVAYTAASSSSIMSSLQLLQQYADQINLAYNNGTVQANNLGLQPSTNLTVTPNPLSTYSEIRFENPEAESFTLSLYSMHGEKVAEQTKINGNQTRIAKGDLATGVYVVRLASQRKIYTGKVIVR